MQIHHQLLILEDNFEQNSNCARVLQSPNKNSSFSSSKIDLLYSYEQFFILSHFFGNIIHFSTLDSCAWTSNCQGMTYCGIFSICGLRLIGLQNDLQSADCRSRYKSFKREYSCGTCVIVFRLNGTKNLKSTFITPSLTN